jgi:thiosulfate/3-mercaptopyruvate sulfurtransferase
MTYTTLIGTNELAQHLHDPLFCVVDCRFSLEDTSAGARDYASGHIPGAIYADLDRDLSAVKDGRNGRHPLPAPSVLLHTFSRFGIDGRTQVVAYGAQTDMFPARLWWLLRWLGHDSVAVLDGGLEKWRAEGRPLTVGVETRAPRHFEGSPRNDMIASADEAARAGASADARLIDARAPERYRGDVEPIDAAAGHIPGAANYFFKQNLDTQGQMRSPSDLRELLGKALAGTPPDRTVSYCGSGVSACHNLLALERAGMKGAKLYPGSWSEWSSDPKRPVETGNPKAK